MPYIHFTKEQKERANSVDLADFLRRRGEKLIPSGREKRLERDHSITIRGSQWYDHAAERGGGAISFVQNFYGMSYPDAVTHLLGCESGVIYRAAEKEAEEQKEFSLPPENTAMRRVYAYLLQQRNISRDILTEFVRADLIYESCEKSADGRKEYHNVVFVGKDEHGVARHAHKRGLYTMGGGFKRNVAGSDPRYSFHYIGDGDNLFVFEAPIDMLSFITMHPENWKQHSYVALCGVSKHALLWVLEQNPHIQSVVLCLDNDAPGIKAAKRLEDTLREKNYAKVECLFSEAKDWNEELRRQCSSTSEQELSTMKMGWIVEAQIIPLIVVAGAALLMIVSVTALSKNDTLDGIKSKTVGDGQHGTARWATPQEIAKTYHHVQFKPKEWRQGQDLPKEQGLVLGSVSKRKSIIALVDSDDIHCLMIGASGVGKTAFFLYPNLEYACASGMSYLALDTKGDLARNYGTIAHDYYGYQVSVIDLRNPTCSDGNNFLTLVNRYMDIAMNDASNIAARAKAEKYAKILAKTIVNPDGDNSNRGQNAFFYDAAEGLLTAAILLLAEFLPPREIAGEKRERRHIVSVFKLVQDLLEPSKVKGKSRFQVLMSKLPSEHKARWFAGAALNTSEQAMASVLSTVLSRLNAFLDSEMEQILCFDSHIDAESFAGKKSAIFLILPEEDATKNFMAGLVIQNLSRELFSVADENGGKLPNRVVLFCDELGTMPPFDILPLFSAGRSRKLTLVPIIQSLAQLEKNYGKEGAEIITDNVQDTIFGGFAPQSQTAEVLSKALGNRTVLSGSVSKGKNDTNRSLQMMERPLMTPDELKSLPKGEFVVMKTGTHPMRTKLKLFLDWGITFGEPYQTPNHGQRKVYYADYLELEDAIQRSCYEQGAQVEPEQIIPRTPEEDKQAERGRPSIRT